MRKIYFVFILLIWFGNINAQCLPISENMILLDNWTNPFSTRDFSDVWGYFAPDRKEYAIIGDQDSTYIINVSNPNDIELVVSIGEGDNSVWRDYKVFGNYLYMIVDQNLPINDNGIIVYDLSNLPLSVTKTAELNTEFTRGHNVFIDVQNARLYASGVSSSADICVYELIDPANPTLWDCISFDTIDNSATNGYYIHDLFIKDNILYASHGYSGYYIWDMTSKSNITLLGALDGTFFDGGYVHSSWNSDDDNHAIVASEVGTDPKIYWVDQEVPGSMQVLSTFKSPLCVDPGNLNKKRPHNPYIIGDKIYISNYHDGLNILEIDFAQDTLGRVGYYDTFAANSDYSSPWEGNWGAYPYLPSGNILASDITNGLFVLSYTGPSIYTFMGPGTDYENVNNWYNNKKPPINFTGTVIISSDCETTIGGGTFALNAKVIINTGASFTQK